METQKISFDVQAPEHWDRIQLLLRVAVVVALGLLHTSIAWIFFAFYVGLPIAAAIAIQRYGASDYPTRAGRTVLRVLSYWNAFFAYLLFVTDRFPATAQDLARVRLDVDAAGTTTFDQALFRLLTSVPAFVVIALLGWVAVPVSLLAGVSVLLTEKVPSFASRFLRFYVDLQARSLAYHASLVDQHPLTDPQRHWQPR